MEAYFFPLKIRKGKDKKEKNKKGRTAKEQKRIRIRGIRMARNKNKFIRVR